MSVQKSGAFKRTKDGLFELGLIEIEDEMVARLTEKAVRDACHGFVKPPRNPMSVTCVRGVYTAHGRLFEESITQLCAFALAFHAGVGGCRLALSNMRPEQKTTSGRRMTSVPSHRQRGRTPA